MYSAETDSLVQKIEQCIDTCPKFSEIGHCEWNKKATDWCDRVSSLMAELCSSPQHGAKVQKWMNHTISLLQSGKPGRKAYDSLVELLIEGYSAIREGTPADVVLGGPVAAGKTPAARRRPVIGKRKRSCPAVASKMRASKYATQAIQIIENELSDPLTVVTHIEFDEECSIHHDPIVHAILGRLQEARVNLDRNMVAAKLGPARTMTVPYATTTLATPWTMAWNTLTTMLKSQRSQEAIPWTWLAIAAMNSCNFLPAIDVFGLLSLTARQRRAVGMRVSEIKRRWRSSDFIDTVCAALLYAKNTFLKWKSHCARTKAQSTVMTRNRRFGLVDLLLRHHFGDPNNPCYRPLKQREIGFKLSWSQSMVSREMGRLFGEDAMKRYAQCFANGTVTGCIKDIRDGNFRIPGSD